MNKRIKKKCAKNKISFENLFNLRNIVGSENSWDYSTSYEGNLYKKDEFIISFYEHPIEGGFYPNGQFSNGQVYQEFLDIVSLYFPHRHLDELSLFDEGISKLIKYVGMNYEEMAN